MKHELLYDLRHAVPANNSWTHWRLSGSLGLSYSPSLICGFAPWGKEEEKLATTCSSPLFSDSQFTTNGGIQSYYGSNVNFINCVSLTSQEHNYSEIFCLLDLAGALVNQFSRFKNDLKKENSNSQTDLNVCCLCVHVFQRLSHVYARVLLFFCTLK